MNSFANAALLSQASGPTDDGFMALFIVQLMGVFIAVGLTRNVHKVHADPIPIRWRRAMSAVVWSVVILTVVVAILHRDFLQFLWDAFKGKTDPSEGIFTTVNAPLCIYFLADFAALGFLIYATGGAEQSLFSTFLFVLVPITIALGNSPGWKIVLGFAGITIVIFLALIWLKSPAHIHNVNGNNPPRRFWFALITSMCVIFPTAVYCFQNLGTPQATSGASGITRTSTGDPSGTESHSTPLREGAVNRANPVGAVGEQNGE